MRSLAFRSSFFVLLAAAASAQDAVTTASLLARLVRRDWLYEPPPPGERCVQFSSYDRASDKGPSDHDAWYGNKDAGNFLRVETTAAGSKEFVLAECDGPGAVVRLWSANPKGELRFYLDGEPEPVWRVDFASLTRGQLDGLGEPLCGEHGRGCSSYLPIPFARRLKLTCSEGGFYYHVNVLRWPAGTPVESFDPAVLAGETVRKASAALAAQLGRPPAGGDAREVRLALGGEPGLEARCEVEGPAVLERLALQVPNAERDALRSALLIVEVDGERTVEVPIADFFACAPDARPYTTLAGGCTDDGEMWCSLPMPVPGRAVVRVVNQRAEPFVGRLRLWVRAQPVAKDCLLLRASFHLARDLSTRPFSDHLVLDATGRGRFVGVALSVRNPTKSWWGEGDEKITVDGEAFPSTFGTGTEDYFGYAWCCPRLFSAAFHAQPQCDGPKNFGYTSVSRVHVLDAVPFQTHLRFDLEVWHWNRTVKVDYASTAFWYAAPGATSGLPAVPEASARLAPPLSPPPVFTVVGALEGEKLQVLGEPSGKVEVQDCSDYDGQWSQDAHLWWHEAKPGDRLRLAVPVEAAGRYRVQARFTNAIDYGIVQVWLAGTKLGGPIDLFHDGVVPTALRDLGEVELFAGTAELELEIVGANDRAEKGYMVGLDCLVLARR